ncbi:MAG: alpha/beta hydrolase [Chitinophagaceae bacterium]|nr:alpha/beta hydrolase [Chitinophagaceae bacterium]
MLEQQKITVGGTDICYVETNKDRGSTVFFLHGNSSCHRTWDAQLASEKLQQYRMIAFDLPAHGASGTMPDYSLTALGKIMAAAVEQLSDGKPYLLAGVSLGTNIIAEMLSYSVQPEALVLAGPCVIGKHRSLEKIAIPGTAIGGSFTDSPSTEEMNACIRLMNADQSPQLTAQLISAYLSVKDNFRSKLGQSVAAGNYSDELALLEKKHIPVLVVFGTADAAIYPDYLDAVSLPLWNNEIIKIADAGHWVHLDKPEVFNDLLEQIAADVFR